MNTPLTENEQILIEGLIGSLTLAGLWGIYFWIKYKKECMNIKQN